ncbi:MAG: hypothetical protein LDLANPLL_02918 [Turneriella sp.]|nr:hypothetical protein [Turneriella sp.]
MKYILCAFIATIVFFSVKIEAKASLYSRAQKLSSIDPREAEALYSKFITKTTDSKLKRAAKHELFTLRLNEGRLAEAFFQLQNKSFHKRFLSAMEENFRIPSLRANSLTKLLQMECSPDANIQKIKNYLQKIKANVAIYQFVLTVLFNCGAKDNLEVLPDLEYIAKDLDDYKFYLGLFTLQELLGKGDLEHAKEYLYFLSNTALPQLNNPHKLMQQIVVAEARVELKAGNWEKVEQVCLKLQDIPQKSAARKACTYLRAFASIKQEDYISAHRSLIKIKIHPHEIDNRLLKLIAAFGAGKLEEEKLRKFMRRVSYPECAKILRRAANEVLRSKDSQKLLTQ